MCGQKETTISILSSVDVEKSCCTDCKDTNTQAIAVGLTIFLGLLIIILILICLLCKKNDNESDGKSSYNNVQQNTEINNVKGGNKVSDN